MRYALMATYRGVLYEAGVGPTDADIVLFTSSPPREDPGFEPGAGYWRKRVGRDEIDELWESRPVGRYRSEPCLVLEEIGDRLHIAHLGHDAYQAERLGYWQVDRGVYEVVVPREEVTDLVEERVDFQVRRAAAPPPPTPPPPYPPGSEAPLTGNGRWDGGTSYSALGNWDGGNWDGASALGPAAASHTPSSNGTGHTDSQPGIRGSRPGAGAHRSGSSVADALAGRRAREAERPADPAQQPATTSPSAPPVSTPPGAAAPTLPAPPASPPASPPAHSAPAHSAPAQSAPPQSAAPPSTAPVSPDAPSAAPPAAAPPAPAPPAPAPQTGAAPGLPRRGDVPSPPGGRRRRTRVETRWVFKDLIDMAAIPQASYAVDEEIDGALCLIKTDDGYEVFSATDGAKHEVRFFDDEESAYFYLFGVLAAEAVRSGRLVPPAGGAPQGG